MTTDVSTAGTGSAVWLREEDCRLDDFRALVEQTTTTRDVPYADSIVDNVPVYDCAALRRHAAASDGRRAVQAELAHVLLDGPGLAVFRGGFEDQSVVDDATEVFFGLVDDQRREGRASGDHYAKPGANDRVWNALEKLALRAPSAFARYYANDIIPLVATAWLGPAYQVTSQINVVNPGGAAQSPHRDYHLGFVTNDVAERYPVHAHRLSPVLTLQGAIAHCDMPVETGPTMYLPYSQRYNAGFLAWRRPEFAAYFDSHRVQLPMGTGDIVFLSPALFHAAGHNRSSDTKRIVNLLQISSAFGRAMESIDRERMSTALFPVLLELRATGVPDDALGNVIAASSEGYAFPTNLDHEPPIGGLAPPSQADLVWHAVTERWDVTRLADELAAHTRRRRTDDCSAAE
ncbi:MAG: phytanoyl-CoA dioxygenase family protein [Acidimicrobiia bacterium]|nr:phytanoyl-CoA dioxygenase family protein [Acidimicrobiia bacterium]